MANQYYGTAIYFGITTLTASLALTGSIVSFEHTKTAEIGEHVNGANTVVAVSVSKRTEEGTMEFLVQGTGTNSGTASFTLPDVGYVGSITDSAATGITGNWMITKVNSKRAAGDVAKINADVKKWEAITL